MNSYMSKRISARSLPNRKPASERATSVFPTPVGPRNRNEPTGRPGAFSPARERRMARASAEMARSWLMTRLCSSSSMRRSFDISSSLMAVTGLVGKVAVRDVAVRMVHGGGQSVVRVGDGVEFFVAVFDAEKYLDGFLLVRRRHLDGLEAPLERAVPLDGLAEFGGRGGADA